MTQNDWKAERAKWLDAQNRYETETDKYLIAKERYEKALEVLRKGDDK